MSAAMQETVLRGPYRVVVERDSVNDDSVVLTRLLCAHGAAVTKGQPVLEIETSKSATEIVAPEEGRLVLHAKVGDELPIGQLMFEIVCAAVPAVAADVGAPLTGQDSSSAESAAAPSADAAAVLSFAARRAAQARGISPDQLPQNAWVISSDLDALTGVQRVARLPRPPGRSEGLSKRKQTEIHNLLAGNAHGLTSTIGASLQLTGNRLVRPAPIFRDSVADLVVFEGARLLRRYPRLNGCWVSDKQIELYQDVNFGVSFDSGDNLKVLAIRRADTLSLSAVQQEFVRLLELYESGERIDTDLLTDATVTLSDLSNTGASYMHPLLNGHQSLIVGVTRPHACHYEFFASFDHRVSEGLMVAQFLSDLQQRIASHFREAGAVELACSACSKPMAEELRLGGRGLLNVTLANGSSGLLCRNCFSGY
jgi:pyruvate/2-oxoglutarate dehydrogenase complex dihydrolipoamide acyltransferase (E2) component